MTLATPSATTEQHKHYRICQRCVMDTSDPEIQFDADGTCNHCATYFRRVSAEGLPTEGDSPRLAPLVERIRASGRGKEYDCIIGLSGGVDSSYVAWKVKELGLRPLAVHLDNGWDSNLAVTNIHKIVQTLGIDLHTDVLDWDEFRSLQLAFLRASTPDSEIPSDHAIQAALLQAAARHGVKYIVAGSNFATEGIMPRTWSHGMRDWRYIKAVNDLFGDRKLETFPHFTLLDLLFSTYVRGVTWTYLLNYVVYDKAAAIGTIERDLGWTNYGGKHYESIYTRFFQAYILPRKFGYDKRRAHLSTLICSGQVSREQALEELKKPTAPADLLEEDRRYVVKKLGITEDEFERIMAAPPKTFWDYPSYERSFLWSSGLRLRRMLKGLPPMPMSKPTTS